MGKLLIIGASLLSLGIGFVGGSMMHGKGVFIQGRLSACEDFVKVINSNNPPQPLSCLLEKDTVLITTADRTIKVTLDGEQVK